MAAKRFSPTWLHMGIIHKEEEEQTEIIGGVRQWVMDGTLHPIKGFLLDVLCKQRAFFGALSMRDFSHRHPQRSREVWPAEETRAEERESAPAGYPPVKNKVNTVDRKRKEVYLCHRDSRWDTHRCFSMYKRLVPELWQAQSSSPIALLATAIITSVSAYCWSNPISVDSR